MPLDYTMLILCPCVHCASLKLSGSLRTTQSLLLLAPHCQSYTDETVHALFTYRWHLWYLGTSLKLPWPCDPICNHLRSLCNHLQSFAVIYNHLYLTCWYANISYIALGVTWSHCHSDHCIATSHHHSAAYLFICLLRSIYRILVTQHPWGLTKPIAHVTCASPYWSEASQ
jgi:hypothetical protein